MNKRGLGKGLGALIPENNDKEMQNNSVIEIKITEIEANEKQPRRMFNDAALGELAESIKEQGIIQPIIVRKVGNSYQIIAGERRWRAARQAGLKSVPAISKECTDMQVMEMALIENIQREDLNSIEEAYAYKSLIEEYKLTQEEVAKRIGKSRPAIANTMRLIQLPVQVRNMIIDGSISPGHARALLSINDERKQLDIAKKIIEKDLNVRQVENLVKNELEEKKTVKAEKKKEIEITEVEDRLKSALGTKVNIINKKGKGKIEIEYYSTEDFNRIIEALEK